jgi:hypothetical protein
MNSKPPISNFASPDQGGLEALARKGLAQLANPASLAELERITRALARLRPAALHAMAVAAGQPSSSGKNPAQTFLLTLKTLAP